MKTWIHKNAGTLAIVFGLVVVAAAGPVEDAVQAAERYQRVILSGDAPGLRGLLPPARQQAIVQLASSFAGKMDGDIWNELLQALSLSAAASVKHSATVVEMYAPGRTLFGLTAEESRLALICWGGKIAGMTRRAPRSVIAHGQLEMTLEAPTLSMSSVELPKVRAAKLAGQLLPDGRVAISRAGETKPAYAMVSVDGRWMPQALHTWFVRDYPVVLAHVQGLQFTPATNLALRQAIRLVTMQAQAALRARNPSEFRQAVNKGMTPFQLLMKLL